MPMIRPIEESYFPRQRGLRRKKRDFKDWLGRPVYGEDEATAPLMPRPLTSLEDMLMLQDPTFPRRGLSARRLAPVSSSRDTTRAPESEEAEGQYVFDFMIFRKKTPNHFN